MVQRVRRIGVYLDLVAGHGRGTLMGIRRYADEVATWHCVIPPTTPDGISADISKWTVDGWIAFGRDNTFGRRVARRSIPTVWVSTSEALAGDPAVIPDNFAVGTMAFDYLFDRGFRNFGFVGFNMAFSRQRQEGLVASVESIGRRVHTFTDFSYDDESLDRVSAWLAQLPRPIGILACEDHIGSLLLDCCHKVGLSIPDAVAVLGVDNDELRCTVRLPSLSSIETGCDRIGYQAAALLDRMLSGEAPPSKPTYVAPIAVVTRHSTDALAFTDDEVRTAVHFIRSRISQPTSVADVIAHTAISPQALDARFRKQLRSPVLRYIQKLHVEHAINLLTGTDAPIAQIARDSGFRSATRMAIVFRRLTGKSPREYRPKATEVVRSKMRKGER